MKGLRYTIRLLLRSPGFAITAVLIFGFGIGVNTAIFSLVDAVFFKSLPYPKPDRLIQFFLTYQGREDALDYPDYLDICSAQHSFDSLAAVSDNVLNLTGRGDATRLNVDFVSASLFKVSGRPCVLGRSFTESEDIAGGPLVIVLDEQFWKSRFNSDPNIIGQNLTLSDHTFEVIGVAPAQLNYWSPCDAYVPINALTLSGYPLMQRGVHLATGLGRLKDGVSLAQAQADLESIHRDLVVRYPESEKDLGIRVVALRDYIVADYSATIWLLGTAVACLLLISCGNIANLLFARSLERREEMTARAALGAGRIRLVGQLLFETSLLSLLGGGLSLLIAFWAIETIKKLGSPDIYRIQHRFEDMSFETRTLWFAITVTALTALLSGFLPALSLSQANLVSTLKAEGGRIGTPGRRRQYLQSFLVTAQVTLACVLFIGAGLLVRSFQATQNVPLGFEPQDVLTVELWLKSKQYESDGERKRAFWDALLSKVGQLPGVSEVALNDFPPFYFGDLDWGAAVPFSVVGRPDLDPEHKPKLDWHTISPGYFGTLRIPLLSGRNFGPEDNVNNRRVVIVDQPLAQRFFPCQDPLGQ